MKRAAVLLTMALVLAACSGGSGSGIPGAESGPGTVGADGGSGTKSGAGAGAPGAEAGHGIGDPGAGKGVSVLCSRWKEGRPLPLPDPSPVTVEAFVREDPGISAPVQASIPSLPVSLVIRFGEAVDPGNLRLEAADTRCDYAPGPIGQKVRWLSDREAEVTIDSLPEGKPGPYAISFGGGRDRGGRLIAEPWLLISLEAGPRLRVYAVPSDGGTARLILDRRGYLEVRSVSPDGRYIYMTRRIMEYSNSHSPVRIPYVVDLKTGVIRTYSRGEANLPRWDLADHALWINGWQRLDLETGADNGDELLHLLPRSTGALLAAQASPDGRWLAALQEPDLNDQTGLADLLLVDRRSGEVRSLQGVFGYQEPMEGPPHVPLLWLEGGKSLLIGAFRRAQERWKGDPEPYLLDPESLGYKQVEAAMLQDAVANVSPGGSYFYLSQIGIVALDGRVLKISSRSSGHFTPDDRYWVGADGRILNLATGASFPFTLPAELAGAFPDVIGISDDQKLIYIRLTTWQ